MNRKILDIALPSIASNITVPLLGLVDMAITGHLGATAYMGAVAVGGSAFSLIYWLFGFLRMGTSGLTSQALGAGDEIAAQQILLRSLLFALLGTVLLLIFQTPLSALAFTIFDAQGKVDFWARTYFSWLIWGTPAILGQYAVTGWFIGRGNTRLPLYVSFTQNLINIPASIFFVFYLGWKVEGVAAGTLLSQYIGFLLAFYFLGHRYGAFRWTIRWKAVCHRSALLRFFHINRDIFLRTLCLLSVMAYFTRVGAASGEIILAVNALLLQFYLIASYVIDGFACAGQVLGGHAVGNGDRLEWQAVVRRVFLYGGAVAIGFTLCYFFFTSSFLALLTNDQQVIMAAAPYTPYAVLIPLISFGAFIWDGLYIGATATKLMLLSVALSAFLFFITYILFADAWGNHALWVALSAFLLSRSLLQTWLARYLSLQPSTSKPL